MNIKRTILYMYKMSAVPKTPKAKAPKTPKVDAPVTPPPVGPVTPVTPVSPVTPVAPVTPPPVGPVIPAPVAPVGPVEPVAPLVPPEEIVPSLFVNMILPKTSVEIVAVFRKIVFPLIPDITITSKNRLLTDPTLINGDLYLELNELEQIAHNYGLNFILITKNMVQIQN
jgi:hypothetical protein